LQQYRDNYEVKIPHNTYKNKMYFGTDMWRCFFSDFSVEIPTEFEKYYIKLE